jgi:hypothetical protein
VGRGTSGRLGKQDNAETQVSNSQSFTPFLERAAKSLCQRANAAYSEPIKRRERVDVCKLSGFDVAREPHHHGGPCLHALFSSQAQPTFYVHNRLSAQQLASSSFTLLPSTRLPIMPYGKTDELAINTIRTLAVCFPSSPAAPPRE